MEEIAGKNHSIPLTEEQRKIVEAAPDARVLVTAGPGTGKTHVLVARVAHLIDRYEMSPGADLLVLTFSRAAIREVRLRLAAQESDARYVSAVTFDSFATRLLAEVDPQGAWSGMSYEGRIREATKLVLSNDQAIELVSGIRHIMVDEIQDLVGERADFVRAILGKVGEGFTLFGDPAQGIYTFQLDKRNRELGAAALYQWLQQRFPDLILHTLTVNHRAQTTAAKRALWAGHKLNEPQPNYSDIWFRLETEVLRCRSGNVGHYARELSKPNMPTAILCRTNGQVLLVSRELHQHGIAHHVQRSATERVVPAWVATVLGDAQLKKIKRSVFDQLFTERVVSDVINAELAWHLLKQMDLSPGSSVDSGVVAMRIRAGFVPDELLEYPRSSLIVSTIHRAKGLEFDRVLLAGIGSGARESDEADIAEETRILYVGMTRPRQELWHLQLPDCVGVSKSERTGRWIRRKYKGLITDVEIWGDDVHREDPACAYLHTECDPINTQKYIAEVLHRGAPVKVTLLSAATNGGARAFYLVSHEGRPIGVTSEAFGDSLYNTLKLHANWQVNWPVEISDLTVEGIDSVVGSEAAGRRVGLGTSGLWLRARIGGFGRLHFESLANRKRQALMSFAEYYGFRRALVDALEADIVGPVGGENEVIDDAPITKYIAGILYPAGADTIDFSQDVDEAEDEGETAMPDPPVALANRRYPSSMGMTFAVDSNASPKIQVELGAARYMPILVESDSRGQGKWKREPLGIPPLELVVNVQEAGRRVPVDEGLELFFRVRSADKDGRVSVTLVLINRQTAGTGPGERDRSSFFQPYIRVVALNVAKGAFVERPSTASPVSDEDIRTYSLLYRKRREFAVGHGCSVRWDTAEDPARATRIETTYTPEFELALADSNPMIKSSALTMQFLVDSPKAKALDELRDFCEQYGKWIQSCKQEANTLPANLKITAEAHLEQCSEAYRRMRSGVEVLGEDSLAWQAFRLANKAMLQQRARTVWLHSGKPSGGPVEDSTALWRPFQLAFFLLCLEGIVRTESPDRIMTDLLWFPTGGGKTEAYLGLIAFTVFLRRLRYKDGGGVTALMRYTLRLLTVQQFERAALLICCCETVRQAEGNLGTDPISLGLWVGQAATPNTRKEAQTALNKIALTGQTPPEGSPIQIHVCPWCGTELDYRNYSVQKMPGRMMIACKTPGCAFRDGLPVFVIDEDVYDFRPTLIIATVDKFASLPWKDQVAALFNLQHGGQVSARRPELIIQDELHLISGPLGTLVGLYETAVDLLCTDDGIRPKIIASTATIRRAQDQANHLFNRKVRQFPPPALDAGDSYFAVEVGPEAKGNRMYIGLMAPGTSQTTLLVRTYAALLQKAFEIPGPDNIKDPYWTLVGYFNSLRVLGGARMQVQDDVNDRIGLLARQSGASEREIESVIELTSREPSSSIPDHLKHMAMSLPAPNTLDVILATNMISVGVDIDRLGLMVVMGQPQSTSEYIQSTSRVGRKWPGLIVTLLNSARSRDRSHYESFVAYHSALYRQVEAASVTPFSARARDRGLHSVIVALSRLLLPSFRSNDSARSILSRRSDVEDIAKRILERVDVVSEDEVASTQKQIEELLDRWASLAETKPGLTYADLGDPQNSLLVDAAKGDSMPELEDHFAALWSLRDVDKECQLQIVSGDGG